jgi:cation diffusion facilitator family transporter
MIAWYLTDAVAIFTDALESTVNVAAGLFGLFSVWLAAKPRDANHPYGHGKIEYVSAAVEGTLIFVAGILIIYQSVTRLFEVTPLHRLDAGLILINIRLSNMAKNTFHQLSVQVDIIYCQILTRLSVL